MTGTGGCETVSIRPLDWIGILYVLSGTLEEIYCAWSWQAGSGGSWPKWCDG